MIWLVYLNKCITNAEEGSVSVAIRKETEQYHLRSRVYWFVFNWGIHSRSAWLSQCVMHWLSHWTEQENQRQWLSSCSYSGWLWSRAIELFAVFIRLQVQDFPCCKNDRSGIPTNSKEKKEDLFQQRRRLVSPTKSVVNAFKKSTKQSFTRWRTSK